MKAPAPSDSQYSATTSASKRVLSLRTMVTLTAGTARRRAAQLGGRRSIVRSHERTEPLMPQLMLAVREDRAGCRVHPRDAA